MKNNNTLVLAHYYTTPEVQAMADYVGDSLDLAQHAEREKAKRIVFAGVKFMAETAKILNPEAEVILPDAGSTCSLVTQTDIKALETWRMSYPDHVHVAYINSSAEHKAMSDWIVTSRCVDDIIKHIYDSGKQVIFSPDRNMGEYLNFTYGYNMPVWSAVCEVHDKFNLEKLIDEFDNLQTGHVGYILAHPESPLSVLKFAKYYVGHERGYIGSTIGMLNFIKNYDNSAWRYVKPVFFVATEDGLLYNMRQARPDLDIRQAPVYSGCQCNSCPYMKLNTVQAVEDAIKTGSGVKIDYMSEDLIEGARWPIQKMLTFVKGQ